MKKVYNFSAGPAMLPAEVMQQAQAEFTNWAGLGSSVMEISHRSKEFMAVAQQAEADLRELLSISDDYAVLFMHGGGRGQFSSIPLNLSVEGKSAEYLVTGSWSKSAVPEASKFTSVFDKNIVEEANGKQTVSLAKSYGENASYVHYCPNETVDGIEISELPQTNGVPLVADMSSCILSRPIDVSQYGAIYAGAQKNIGPSGLAIVIVRKDLLARTGDKVPGIMDFRLTEQNDSMFNTPPTYAWYLAGLVFKWLKKQGGVSAMAEVNKKKADLLYDYIDSSSFYQNKIDKTYRSRMNVPFQLVDDSLDGAFLKAAEENGLVALKGHRSVGGMRASIYNAMPLEGVQALVDFMDKFATQQRV